MKQLETHYYYSLMGKNNTLTLLYLRFFLLPIIFLLWYMSETMKGWRWNAKWKAANWESKKLNFHMLVCGIKPNVELIPHTHTKEKKMMVIFLINKFIVLN